MNGELSAVYYYVPSRHADRHAAHNCTSPTCHVRNAKDNSADVLWARAAIEVLRRDVENLEASAKGAYGDRYTKAVTRLERARTWLKVMLARPPKAYRKTCVKLSRARTRSRAHMAHVHANVSCYSSEGAFKV